MLNMLPIVIGVLLLLLLTWHELHLIRRDVAALREAEEARQPSELELVMMEMQRNHAEALKPFEHQLMLTTKAIDDASPALAKFAARWSEIARRGK